MRIRYVCERRAQEWWYCYGVLENGFCFGQHVCSAPGFAPGDLLRNQPDRLAALKELFAVEPVGNNEEVLTVTHPLEVPSWWASMKDLQEGLKPMYDRYNEMLADTKARRT